MELMYRVHDIIYENEVFTDAIIQDYLELSDTTAPEEILKRYISRDSDCGRGLTKMIQAMKSDSEELLDNPDKYDDLLENVKQVISQNTGIMPNYVMWLNDHDWLLSFCVNEMQESCYRCSGNYSENEALEGYDVSNAILLAEGENTKLYGFEELPKPFVIEKIHVDLAKK